MEPSIEPRPLRPLVALRALSRLIKSRGKDMGQATIFLRALEGNSGRQEFDRFQRTAVGQRLLRERPRLLDTLAEAAGEDRFPSGTLGHAYYCFMRQHGTSIAGLMDLASSPLDRPLPDDEAFFQERSRVMHDLWHVVTGYDASVLGEVCLMAFRCAQEHHLGFNLFTLGLAIKVPYQTTGAPVRRALIEAYRIGKQATWLRGSDWEALLPMDLDAVRHSFALRTPVVYQRALAINVSRRPAHEAREAADTAASAV